MGYRDIKVLLRFLSPSVAISKNKYTALQSHFIAKVGIKWFDDHEELALVEVKELIEERILTRQIHSFKLPPSNALYLSVFLDDTKVELVLFDPVKRDLDRKAFSSYSISTYGFEDCIDSIVVDLEMLSPETKEHVYYYVDDRRTNRPEKDTKYIKAIHDFMSKIPKEICPDTFSGSSKQNDNNELLCFKHCENEFYEDKIIFKFLSPNINKPADASVIVYYFVFNKSDPQLIRIADDIRHKYAFAAIRYYLRNNARRDYNPEFMETDTKVLNLISNTEQLGVHFVDNHFDSNFFSMVRNCQKEGELCQDVVNKLATRVKDVYKGLTNNDIIGLLVLLCQICNDSVLYKDIIEDILLDYQNVFAGTSLKEYLTLSNSGMVNPVPTHKPDCHYIRVFLVLLYIRCCDYFFIDLGPIIKEMCVDFQNKSVPQCFIDKDTAFNVIHKAFDFFRISPTANGKEEEESMMWFARRYKLAELTALRHLTRKILKNDLQSLMMHLNTYPENC